MPTAHDQRLTAQLAALERRELARRPPRVSHRRGTSYRLDGRDVVGLCSNDYLGFADHPTLANVPPASPGATASRLISGDLEVHREVEAKLAQHVGTPDAVLFPSGFQLNVGVLPALLSDQDHAFSDELNHASLIDGLRLSKAARTVIPHRTSPPPPSSELDGFAWWVTEAIFSMDGDSVDPAALRAHLAAGHCLYLDEAHAFGIYPRGLGLAGSNGVQPTALVGTLGKAVGCAGAFVGGTRPLCAWIRSRARSFVFSTGMSPALAARVSSAIDLLRGTYGDDARARLWSNVDHLATALGDPAPASPIFPIFIGANQDALDVSAALLALGWHVQPIRPPTVPVDTARLRVTVTADHTHEQLDRFLHDLSRVLHRHGLPVKVRRAPAPIHQPEPGPPA